MTWNPLEEKIIKYLPQKHVIIISPMANFSPYAFNFLAAHDDKKSNLKTRELFDPIISSDTTEQCRREKYWRRFAQTNDIELSGDNITVRRQQVIYGALVAKFLDKAYNELKNDRLRMVFHGVDTIPCFLMLNKERCYGRMETVYLMHQPVLGDYMPLTQDSMAQKAAEMGKKYEYEAEKAAMTKIDHLMVTSDPQALYGLVKRHYQRVPSLFADYFTGKNSALAIEIDFDEMERQEEERYKDSQQTVFTI